MTLPGPVNTRAAIFYGDRLSEACRVLGVTGTIFDDADIISSGTFTKLRRRFRGSAVEEATRDRIIEFLKDRADGQAMARLKEINLDLENDVLVPAWYQLTDQARIAATKVRPFIRNSTMKADHIDERHLASLMRGEFAVRKHIIPLAQHIFTNCQVNQIELPRCEAAIDLINEENFDHNICFPQIYRRVNRVRVPQLGLVDGGHSEAVA